MIEQITRAGAAFRSLGDPLWDTSNPQGRLLARIAEFERELFRERTEDGSNRGDGSRCHGLAASSTCRNISARTPSGAVPLARR